MRVERTITTDIGTVVISRRQAVDRVGRPTEAALDTLKAVHHDAQAWLRRNLARD